MHRVHGEERGDEEGARKRAAEPEKKCEGEPDDAGVECEVADVPACRVRSEELPVRGQPERERRAIVVAPGGFRARP
jgi:hypothetical protein